MECKLIILILLTFSLFFRCSNPKNCDPQIFGNGQTKVYVEAISTFSILESEINRNILERTYLPVRKDELHTKYHFKLKIVNQSGFSGDQITFLKNHLMENINVYEEDKLLGTSLFIDETSFSAKNMGQYFAAYERNIDSKRDHIEMRLNFSQLGVPMETLTFNTNCF